MTKAELINALSEFPDNMEVVFCYSAGDYWHSIIAKSPESIETRLIEYSAYHQENIVSIDQDELKEESKEVITLW